MWREFSEEPEITSDFIIDAFRVRWLLEDEFAKFCEEEFYSRYIPMSRVLRAYFIAWMCVFLTDVVTRAFRERLERFVRGYKGDDLVELLPLEIALFKLTDDRRWLNRHRLNFDHHDSEVRTFTTKSLSLVADCLDFGDVQLQARMEKNLQSRHDFAGGSVAVLAVAKGTITEKCKRFQELLNVYGYDMAEAVLLMRLIDQRFAENPLLHHFQRVQNYVALRLFCPPPAPGKQLPLPGIDGVEGREMVLTLGPDDGRFVGQEGNRVIQEMWQRINCHPLGQGRLFLKDNL